MTKKERLGKLMEILQEEDFVSVSELSQRLGSSMMTIRRDLEPLEEKGVLKRVHGGAMLQKNEANVPSFTVRFERNITEKNAIGKLAATLIQPESSVCFDAGTTTLAIVRNIPQALHFTAITTGIRTSLELSQFRDVEIIQVGGSLDHGTLTICNEISAEFIKRFRADVAFLSTRAIDTAQGSYDNYLNLVGEKRALASIAKKVVVVADHTKFDNTPLCLAVPLHEIDVLITDNGTEVKHVEELRKAGVEVLIAEA